jgi:hypothetical protein
MTYLSPCRGCIMPNGSHARFCPTQREPSPPRKRGDACGCRYYLDDEHFDSCHNYVPRGVWSGG